MRTARHATRAAALAAVIGATVLGVGLSADGSTAARHGHAGKPPRTEPLHILLTNDDGYTATGLIAVRDALRGAGYDVTVVAPLTNQSGTSARATFGGSLQVIHPDATTYAVDGSPADATEVGLSSVFAGDPPDLVISGSNAGQNVAAATIHSGTVGAAVTAIEDGVPAIAVSTELTATSQPYAETAAFVVRLVKTLQSKSDHGRLLPVGTGLNVNYPAVDTGRTPRPRLTQIGTGFLDLAYAGALPAVGATATLAVTPNADAVETQPNADDTALTRDQISISVIQGDYDAPVGDARRVGQRLVSALDR